VTGRAVETIEFVVSRHDRTCRLGLGVGADGVERDVVVHGLIGPIGCRGAVASIGETYM
jgi:hypothetical protein